MNKPRERSFDFIDDEEREYWKQYGIIIFGDEKLNRQAIGQLLDDYGIDDNQPGQFWGFQKSIWNRDHYAKYISSDIKTRADNVRKFAKTLRKSIKEYNSLLPQDIHSLSVVPQQYHDFFQENFPEVGAQLNFGAFEEENGPFRNGFPMSTLLDSRPLSINMHVFVQIIESICASAETRSDYLKDKLLPKQHYTSKDPGTMPERLVATNFLIYFKEQTGNEFISVDSGERVKCTSESISFTQSGFTALGITDVNMNNIRSTCNRFAKEEHERRKMQIDG